MGKTLGAEVSVEGVLEVAQDAGHHVLVLYLGGKERGTPEWVSASQSNFTARDQSATF